MIYHCAEEKIEAALKDWDKPTDINSSAWYFMEHQETIRRALLFTQKAMGEPSEGMKEAAWNMPDIKFGEIPEANWKYMAAKLWEETDEV